MSPLSQEDIDIIVRLALDEDGVGDDATVEFLQTDRTAIRAEIVARQDAVVAGMALAGRAFELAGSGARFDGRVADADAVRSGQVLASVEGPAAAVLGAERVALNFLQRMCGVATLARRFVDSVAGSGVTILDTRKTTPLWRDLEKYAVRCGGALNHRRDLGAMVLVKENHIRALGGEAALISHLNARGRADVFVEVEVDSLAFLDAVLATPVDRVMLDNFPPAEVEQALRHIVSVCGDDAPEVEVSGGVTLDNIGDYALEGVDYISVGAITHSAPAADLSLEVR